MRKKKTVFESSQKDARRKTIQVEPKDESQEEIVQAFFIEYNRLMQGGRPQHSVALKLLDKFSLTRKRG